MVLEHNSCHHFLQNVSVTVSLNAIRMFTQLKLNDSIPLRKLSTIRNKELMTIFI
jgi:hypothetical protein